MRETCIGDYKTLVISWTLTKKGDFKTYVININNNGTQFLTDCDTQQLIILPDLSSMSGRIGGEGDWIGEEEEVDPRLDNTIVPYVH